MTKCPKCGGEEILVVFHEWWMEDQESGEFCSDSANIKEFEKDEDVTEHLHYTCSDCKYRIIARTKNHKTEGGK